MTNVLYKKTVLAMIIACSLFFANAADAAETTILAFGDSLTAGLGLPLEKAFPSQLETELKKRGYEVRLINAGVSGDTTSGGLTRLDWVLDQQKPDFVILELGANDMLRGTDPAVTRRNLEEMLKILQGREIPVLLAGMKAPPNLGLEFQAAYNKMYPALAEEFKVPLYPFFLDGVAAHPDLMQEDGAHPNVLGVAVIVQGISPFVEKFLKKSD